MNIHRHFNKDFIHHQKSSIAEVLKEVVFGMEDGMVSTLGSITGIAVGSGNHFTIILAGIVIIAVESISMGIGSYLSNRSQEEVEERKLQEEAHEIKHYPKEEKLELYEMYLHDGWTENLAGQMAEEASQKPSLILKEMAVKELKIVPGQKSVSIKGGFYMFFAYIIGGAIPLFAYFLLPIKSAIPISIITTLIGLVALGVGTTKFTKQPLFKSGFRMLLMGGIALAAGLAAGLLIKQ
ncbi:MAG: VIT1/CCC1 transporter family protein [Candidatus Doudnabacteria bacterium]|nr:VIT1/CCC1 transporter family protein [Candidatus Doudnabacteria bacterium]